MKSLTALFALTLATLLVACTTADDISKAEQYKLELQYYQYAVDFAGKGMRNEAVERCDQTHLLHNECYVSIVQVFLQQGGKMQKGYCDAIEPSYKANLTNRALGIVYRDLDADLANELKIKMNPTSERIAQIQTIKEDCYGAT